MVWFFRLSLFIAALSVAFPASSTHVSSSRDASDFSSQAVTSFVYFSDTFSEPEGMIEDTEEVSDDFQSLAFGAKRELFSQELSKPELPTFLSSYWGRLQFLNIPPPAVIA